MFDKNIFFYKKFYRVIDTIFFLKKNKNIVWSNKLSKIKFTGKVYRLKKLRLVLTPKINISHNYFIEIKNLFLKRRKKEKIWKIFSYLQKLPKVIINVRFINIYTKRGFWENKFFLKEKKKVKNN